MTHKEIDDLSWYVIRTKPKQEDRADGNLRAWNVETFAPKLKETRFHPYTGEHGQSVKHLFPQYIFARFRLGALLHKMRFTRGVQSVVSFGDTPASVDEAIIKLIRSRIDADGFVVIGEKPRPGDQVTVNYGPLKALTGVFEREMKEGDRVRILLKTVSYQAHIVVSAALMAKSGDPDSSTSL